MNNSYIDIKNLKFQYPQTGFTLDIPKLSLYKNEVTTVLGNNGSGKTTLTKLIMGIIKPPKNNIMLSGQDISTLRLCDIGKRIGYLFQNPDKQLFCTTAQQEIAFSLKNCGIKAPAADKKAFELLKQFDMQHLADKFPLHFSMGEKRRLALLAIFAMNPEYYILDEPSNGLDEQNKKKLMEMLKKINQNNTGFCIITHDDTLLTLTNRTFIMQDGKVVSDERN